MDWVLTLLGQLKAEVSTIFMVTHWHYKTVWLLGVLSIC